MAKLKRFAKLKPKAHAYKLVVGSSKVGASDAVAAAQVQVNTLAGQGWEAISASIAESATVYTKDVDGADQPVFAQSFDVVVLMGN